MRYRIIYCIYMNTFTSICSGKIKCWRKKHFRDFENMFLVIQLKAARGRSPPPPCFGFLRSGISLAWRGGCLGRWVDAIVDQLVLGRFLADSWQIPGRFLADFGNLWATALRRLLICVAYWLIDRLIDRLIDWLIDRLIASLIDWSIDWVARLIDRLIDWLIDRWTIYRCTSKWNWTLTRWAWRGRRVFGLCAWACFASRQHGLRNAKGNQHVVLYGSHGYGNNLVTKTSPV